MNEEAIPVATQIGSDRLALVVNAGKVIGLDRETQLPTQIFTVILDLVVWLRCILVIQADSVISHRRWIIQGVFTSNQANIYAVTASGTNDASGIEGTSDTRVGVTAGTTSGVALAATSIGSGIGILVNSNGREAVNASSQQGIGVYATSQDNFGVLGVSSSYSYGVVGKGANAGVAAFNPNNQNAAYLASDCCAAWFTGKVTITGALLKGGGGFRIDHPLDPSNKFLSHSFVESSEMKNLYDGIAEPDPHGEAVVELPQWFESLNQAIRYQLTPIGSPSPDLHIKVALTDGKFTIGGAKPGTQVSWQVTGIRKDAWAEHNRITVEETKDSQEQGRYLHPELHGESPSRGIGAAKALKDF